MIILQIITIALLAVILAGVAYIVSVNFIKNPSRKNYMFVDTSVLIDGRIVPIVQTGFVTDTIAIPRSVIGELQFLADNADHDKRERARRGLDVVQELQAIDVADVIIYQDGSKAAEGVDERLLNLAKKHGGSVCTIDYNLIKVAEVEKIAVRNINDLAKNLRMVYMPGERTTISLVTKGQDSHQGVGYLQDGTMVVVEQASGQIGSSVEVEFTRSLQTAAGKMMFARRLNRGTQGEQVQGPVSKAAPKTPAKNAVKSVSRGRGVREQKQSTAAAATAADKPEEQRENQSSGRTRNHSSRSRNSKASPRKNIEDSLLTEINKQ